MTQLAGFFTPWIIYAVITLLYYFLPGKMDDRVCAAFQNR
jgi:hypothetical protein